MSGTAVKSNSKPLMDPLHLHHYQEAQQLVHFCQEAEGWSNFTCRSSAISIDVNMENILTSCITVWYGISPVPDHKALQQVVVWVRGVRGDTEESLGTPRTLPATCLSPCRLLKTHNQTEGVLSPESCEAAGSNSDTLVYKPWSLWFPLIHADLKPWSCLV